MLLEKTGSPDRRVLEKCKEICFRRVPSVLVTNQKVEERVSNRVATKALQLFQLQFKFIHCESNLKFPQPGPPAALATRHLLRSHVDRAHIDSLPRAYPIGWH